MPAYKFLDKVQVLSFLRRLNAMKLKNAKSGFAGFTLIELMIVVAIIGVLAAIAVPKFADLVKKAQEGRTRANLDQVRGALNIYYGDNEGIYPRDTLATLTTNSKYMSAIKSAQIPAFSDVGNTGHTEAASVTAAVAYSSTTDTGSWQYVNNDANVNWGTFYVGCSHNDSKSKLWNTW